MRVTTKYMFVLGSMDSSSDDDSFFSPDSLVIAKRRRSLKMQRRPRMHFRGPSESALWASDAGTRSKQQLWHQMKSVFYNMKSQLQKLLALLSVIY